VTQNETAAENCQQNKDVCSRAVFSQNRLVRRALDAFKNLK